MVAQRVHVDALIIGGGAAGLWVLNDLVRKGYDACLVESRALGNGQTINSQGMIHGGIKYALSQDHNRDSALQVSPMPGVWKNHLSGTRIPDLRGVEVKSNLGYLWVSNSYTGDLEGLFSPTVEELEVKPVRTDSAPRWLRDSSRAVFTVDEPVIDTFSLLETLATPHQDRILYYQAPDQMQFSSVGGRVEQVYFPGAEISIVPETLILTAGNGNKTLAQKVGIKKEIMQERPLRQVIVRSHELPELYGHCIDGGRPEITITTHKAFDGETVWNVGGKIAENGHEINPQDLIVMARERISDSLPILSRVLFRAAYSTLDIVRAEAKTPEGKRPNGVNVGQEGNVIYAWPTKLAMVPVLAEEILERVPRPSNRDQRSSSLKGHFQTGIRIARPVWDED